MQSVSGLLIPTGRLAVLDSQGITGSGELGWRSFSPVAVLGAIPTVARVGVAVECLGELPGTEVGLMRGLARTETQRGGRSTVGQ
jgi:hypothetical protein